jgi:hypothetical protein
VEHQREQSPGQRRPKYLILDKKALAEEPLPPRLFLFSEYKKSGSFF